MSGIDRIRAARTYLRAGGELARAVRANPRLARELLAGVIAGSPADSADSPPAEVRVSAEERRERLAPSGLGEFAKTAHAEQTIDAPIETVWAYLRELGRLSEWFSLHHGWRGDPPGPLHTGQTFTQQAQVMGLPVDIAWRVAAVSERGFELRGQAPQQVRLGYWITVSGTDSQTVVDFDAGVAGPPIEGPLGGSVARSLEEAMRESLDRMPTAIAGYTPPARPAREPVLHTASGVRLDPATPVLIGAGQIVQRTPDESYSDPAELAVRALRRAAVDAGADAGLLGSADAVFAVACTSWQYRDLGAVIAERVGAGAADTVQSSPFGGDGAQLLLNEAAAAIAAGQYEIVLVAGAEAGATQAAAQRAGIDLQWPAQDPAQAPTRIAGVDKPANNAAETAAGLIAPIHMYALIESANRHRLGRTPAEHSRQVAQLWSRLSQVAAGNEYAWQPEKFSAEQIAAVSGDNRMVSTPYTKLECANPQVDMASGIIVASVAAATAAGIPQEKWVFPHAGASGCDEWFVSERAEPATSPAIRALGAAALAHAGITADQLTHVDLYACFPVAVQIAARELGLPLDDPDRPLSMTGGLTFGGGPGNNYSGHAVASLITALRADPQSYGLATALGWYLTKHSLGVYSATPPRAGFEHLTSIIDTPPPRPARTEYEGPAVIEAYTVPHGRDGEPEAAIVSLIAPDGARILVRSNDKTLIDRLIDTSAPDAPTAGTRVPDSAESDAAGSVVAEAAGPARDADSAGPDSAGRGDALGLPVTVRDGQISFTAGDRMPLPPPPAPPVLVERRGAVTIITINRPEVRNAVNLATALGIERALDAYEADPHAQVAILTGAGGYFSAGMDLKAAARGEVPVTQGRGILGIAAQPPRKPLIAAVEGPALAGGCELALSADLIVAARNSTFGIPEVKRGLVAVGGGVLRLARRIPRAIAMELALTGDPITAARAAELGLVNQLADPGGALEAALALAERIAVNAPLSILASKRIIEESADWTVAEEFTRQGQVAAAALASQDATEGVLAFTQKRPPVWKGR
ncbi:crotonase/enoyl-CoA hydratase family protein [Nocardia sp. NEAU-G5]|uniref:Crotonase/enoyl-CoA hydratase family protein n=1 Tax=Nocardia albiluteola TaxID=2842303 RepID=A0ABS6B353_9NOCA|nr:crotonase/enoyl-CoA hydratase family protein [Nocardia albiluteola]MBU3064732.1 crotonase/enoyl-CoA hydratase family protein [Nocardia albiluteola]